mmetsp:Transcript_4457/g.5301  ORF Transcript_4457/g.5301 Transcript_4457/m.5301 type:complete len:297 (+) Transcript_4457:2-892(+)
MLRHQPVAILAQAANLFSLLKPGSFVASRAPHASSAMMSVAQTSSSDKDVKRLAAHKQTRLCKFFAVGACTKGTACPFAHGVSHLREQPDFSKTRLCADFMEMGFCSQGDQCKFAHGKQELRPGSSAKSRSKGKAKVPNAEDAKPKSCGWGLQSGYEQAALKLILKSALGGQSQPRATGNGKCAAQWVEWTEGKGDCYDLNVCTSFSRQTTCEGVETSSAHFSRCSSATSDSSIPEMGPNGLELECPNRLPVAEPTTHETTDSWQVRVKNTFIEVEDETIQEGCGVRKSRSMPSLL